MIKLSLRGIVSAAAVLIIFFIETPLRAQKVTVSPGIPVTGDEIRSSVHKESADELDASEILIYGYTPPTEVYTLNSEETLEMETEPGELRALVKLYRGGKMDRAVFAAGKGNDITSMIQELGKNLLQIFSH